MLTHTKWSLAIAATLVTQVGFAGILGDDFVKLDVTELNAINNFIADHDNKNILVIKGQYDPQNSENANVLNDDALGFASLVLDNSETQGGAGNAFKLNASGNVIAPVIYAALPGDNATTGAVNVVIASNAFSNFCDAATPNTKKNFFGFSNRQNNGAFPHVQLGGQAICYQDAGSQFPILTFYQNLGGCGAIFDITASEGLNPATQQLTCAAAQGQSAKNHKRRGGFLRPASGFELPNGAIRQTAINNGNELYQADDQQVYYVTPGTRLFQLTGPGSQLPESADQNGKVTLTAGTSYLISPFVGNQNSENGVFENPSFQTVRPLDTQFTHSAPSSTSCSGDTVALNGAITSKLGAIKGVNLYKNDVLVKTLESKPSAILFTYQFTVDCPDTGSDTYTLFAYDKLINRTRDKIMGNAGRQLTVSRFQLL